MGEGRARGGPAADPGHPGVRGGGRLSAHHRAAIAFGQWKRHERDAARRLAEVHGVGSVADLLRRYLRRRDLFRLDAELAREALRELAGDPGPMPSVFKAWMPGDDSILAGRGLPVCLVVCEQLLVSRLEAFAAAA